MTLFIEIPEVNRRFSRAVATGSSNRSWWNIKNAASDEAELLIYDEIGGWFGSLAEDFIAELKAVTAPNIRVRLNSPGGSVFEGVAIANALRAHPANITVQVDGIAASIASVIALAGDRLIVQPQSMMMIHDASGVCMGDASDMTQMASVLDKLSDNIASAYAAKAGGDVADWRVLMTAETWYTAEEAVAAGLADEVGKQRGQDDPEPEPAATAKWDLSVFKHAPTMEANVDGAGIGKTRPAAAAAGTTSTAPVTATSTAVPVHHTSTVDATWDAGAAQKQLPSPVPVATARKVYAWYNVDQVEDNTVPKTACKLPHHEVSADGTPGAANLAGVRNALSRLSQSDIPAGEHDAIRVHLQGHLDDADTDNLSTVEVFARAFDEILSRLPAAPAAPVTTAEPELEPATATATNNGWSVTASWRDSKPTNDWGADVANWFSNPKPSSSAATAA